MNLELRRGARPPSSPLGFPGCVIVCKWEIRPSLWPASEPPLSSMPDPVPLPREPCGLPTPAPSLPLLSDSGGPQVFSHLQKNRFTRQRLARPGGCFLLSQPNIDTREISCPPQARPGP